MNADVRKAHYAVQVAIAVAETIKEAGPIAEGPLYAMLMSLVPGLDLATFNMIIHLLVRTGAIEKKGFLLSAKTQPLTLEEAAKVKPVQPDFLPGGSLYVGRKGTKR